MAPETRVPKVYVQIPLDLLHFGADGITKLRYHSIFIAMWLPTRLLSDTSSARPTRIPPGISPSSRFAVIRYDQSHRLVDTS